MIYYSNIKMFESWAYNRWNSIKTLFILYTSILNSTQYVYFLVIVNPSKLLMDSMLRVKFIFQDVRIALGKIAVVVG